MQPSNQLKGLVESYNSVYANRQELEEAKVIAETVINSVGVCMVEQGYNESDVKEFFKTSSIAKIRDVFEESLQSEGVQKHLNQETNLFETHLRYIPGAMATRIKNESPEVFSRLTLCISEACLDEAENGMFGLARMAGQIKRAGAKMFGNASQRNSAVSYEKSYDDINQRRGQGIGTRKTVTKGEIDAETAGRRRADPNYKPGQGVDSGSKTKVEPKASTTKAEPKSRIDTTITKPQKPAAAAKPAKPTLTAKQTASNAEYDRLRKSDPAAAKKFGMAASKSNKPKTPNPLMSSPASKAPSGRTALKSSRLSAALDGVKKVKKESSELDLVLQHLVSEGIADSLQGALVMVEGMSDQFINSIIEQAQMGSAMVEFLLQNGEAETVEEAQYIISELDEENIDLLIQSITEGPQAFPFKKVEKKMDKLRPGASAKNIDRTSTRFNALGAARSAAQRREGGV
jgi:hypothetical protein